MPTNSKKNICTCRRQRAFIEMQEFSNTWRPPTPHLVSARRVAFKSFSDDITETNSCRVSETAVSQPNDERSFWSCLLFPKPRTPLWQRCCLVAPNQEAHWPVVTEQPLERAMEHLPSPIISPTHHMRPEALPEAKRKRKFISPPPSLPPTPPLPPCPRRVRQRVQSPVSSDSTSQSVTPPCCCY